MKNTVKSAIIILVNCLFFQPVNCQTPTDLTTWLTQKFNSYVEAVPREEVFIHSDREEYIAGENLWFNIYLIDRQSLRPALKSRIAYLELLNSENRPVVQKRIYIDAGYGPGQILIPDTLGTGRYTLRAYTSWMKNFLPDNCFMKEITIFNSLETKIFRRKKPDTGNAKYAEITSLKDFAGISININNSAPDRVNIDIKADDPIRFGNNDLFYIFIQSHGNIKLVKAEKLNGTSASITIAKSLLGEGINQVTLFNSKGAPVCERFIYTPVREEPPVIIQSSDSFGLRNRISLEIDPGNAMAGFLNAARLSISVAPVTKNAELPDITDFLIFGTEYGSLPWKIIKDRRVNQLSPEIMDSILPNISSNWIDWKLILSGERPKLKYKTEDDAHFLSGKLVSADQQPLKGGELIFICTPGKKSGFQYARTDNEGNFTFDLHIDEEFKDLVIMPDNASKNRRLVIGSSFSDRYLQSEKGSETVLRQIPPCIAKMSLNYQVEKIYRIPATGKPLPPVSLPLRPVRFYGIPDIDLKMADYIKLPVMEEVIFELLPQVSLRKRNSVYSIFVTERIDDNFTVTAPVLMLDGIIIKDASIIANLDPEIVERIDVVKEKYVVGKYIFPAIMNVITKSGDFSNIPFPDYMVRLPYRVTDPVLSFISPDYSSQDLKKSRVPDYRNTLYWNPAVTTGSDGKARVEFWSSDNKADYVIRIQGLTKDGKTISLSKIIRVN